MMKPHACVEYLARQTRASTTLCQYVVHTYALQGFTVDGKSGPSYEMESYSNKCVEVESMGKNENDSLQGFVMNDMVVKNCG